MYFPEKNKEQNDLIIIILNECSWVSELLFITL